jgi:hypothetical protein
MRLPHAETVTLPAPPGALAPPLEFHLRWRGSTRAQRVSMKICQREGVVVITLPPGEGRRAGLALLRAHSGWAMEHIAALAPPLPFAPGVVVPIGGVPHRLRHEPRLRGLPRLEARELVVTGAAEFLARRTTDFLKAEAKRRIALLAPRHMAALGVAAKRIRIKDTRSRWGSCAPDGTLAFSWRLLLAPEWVMDYVVAHEVAHLVALNHSPHFWAQVARLTLDRDAAVEWLRAEGPSLLRIG